MSVFSRSNGVVSKHWSSHDSTHFTSHGQPGKCYQPGANGCETSKCRSHVIDAFRVLFLLWTPLSDSVTDKSELLWKQFKLPGYVQNTGPFHFRSLRPQSRTRPIQCLEWAAVLQRLLQQQLCCVSLQCQIPFQLWSLQHVSGHTQYAVSEYREFQFLEQLSIYMSRSSLSC